MCYAGTGRVVRGQEGALSGGLRWRFSFFPFLSFSSFDQVGLGDAHARV